MNAELKHELFEAELLAPLRGHQLSEDESLIASLLLDASSERPIGIKHIVSVLNSRPRRESADRSQDTGKSRRRRMDDRAVKDIIRTLRKDHEFPILSRKFARKAERDEAGTVTRPATLAGYWYCQSETEMIDFIRDFQQQPLDELHTLSRIVKANYPKLTGQLTLHDAAFSEPPAVAGRSLNPNGRTS
jgi:hypothetical protein